MIRLPRFLAGYLFASVPHHQQEDCFDESLIFLCRHDEEGAIGFIINQVLENISVSDVLNYAEDPEKKPSREDGIWSGPPIFWGGPTEIGRSFLLHSLEKTFPTTISVNDEYGVTFSTDVLERFLYEKVPIKHYSLLLGYVRWKPGQLEKELSQSCWMPLCPTPELIFEVPHHKKWSAAMTMAGIEQHYLSPIQGEA